MRAAARRSVTTARARVAQAPARKDAAAGGASEGARPARSHGGATTVAGEHSAAAASARKSEEPAAPAIEIQPPARTYLLEQAARDEGLQAAVVGRSAHLRLELPDGGALQLHLRLSSEGADIRASGPLAEAMSTRLSELGVALAAEGITLGRFELDSQHREGETARPDATDTDTDAAPAGPRRPTTSVAPASPEPPVEARPGRIHLKV